MDIYKSIQAMLWVNFFFPNVLGPKNWDGKRVFILLSFQNLCWKLLSKCLGHVLVKHFRLLLFGIEETINYMKNKTLQLPCLYLLYKILREIATHCKEDRAHYGNRICQCCKTCTYICISCQVCPMMLGFYVFAEFVKRVSWSFSDGLWWCQNLFCLWMFLCPFH